MMSQQAKAPTLDMQGKTVLITGANSGVGFAMAEALAVRGAKIVMVCRDAVRGEAAWEKLMRASTCSVPVLLLADLSSQRQIRALSQDLHARFEHLDVLINNAGGIFSRHSLTEDGIERSFAVNHLAPFLLTKLLLDLVLAAPAGRVVNVTSEIHAGSIDFDNLQGERSYGFMAAYKRNKLANILFTYELAHRLADGRITVNCFSPGPTRTRFGDDMTGLPRLFPLLFKRVPFLFKSPEQGAETGVYLTASPAVAGISGRYFFRNRDERTKPVSYDIAAAKRLWDVSEQLVSGARDADRGYASAGVLSPSAI
ncbi:MAG TPA: SDR family oxidoreductase [Gammaproteobacteria bacterium]|nr:SDR family oxidoreductase [Gammaproteobacteria bacterium]